MMSLADFDKAAEHSKIVCEFTPQQASIIFNLVASLHKASTSGLIPESSVPHSVIDDIGGVMSDSIDKLMSQFEDYPGQYVELIEAAQKNAEKEPKPTRDIPTGNYL